MIPDWNEWGILPPIREGQDPVDPDRSPYSCTMQELVAQYGISPERRAILRGLLQFRELFYQADIITGFQWLDGSFAENIRLLEDREPNDIDVVTFFDLPEGADDQGSFVKDHPSLFDHDALKQQFLVDSYPYFLGEASTDYGVQQIAYWYSMWSHRREDDNGAHLWKGFLVVALSQIDDEEAFQHLAYLEQEEA